MSAQTRKVLKTHFITVFLDNISLPIKEWFDEDRINWITERYSKPEIKFFATPVLVDNEKKQIVS